MTTTASDASLTLGVLQVIQSLGYLSATNPANLTLAVRDAEGYERRPLLGFKRVAGALRLRHYDLVDGSWSMISEVMDESGECPLLARYLLDFITASATSGELAELQLSFQYRTQSLAPAANLIWGIGEGRIELGRAF